MKKKNRLNFPRAEDEEIRNIREFILKHLPGNMNDMVHEMNKSLEKTYSQRKREIVDKLDTLNNDEDDKVKKKAKEEIAKIKKNKKGGKKK